MTMKFAKDTCRFANEISSNDIARIGITIEKLGERNRVVLCPHKMIPSFYFFHYFKLIQCKFYIRIKKEK